MHQEALFHESISDAIREVVRICGGSKAVGSKLWPEKSPEAAGRLLLDCLNDSRPERLSPDQLLLLVKLGRERGCHAIAVYIAREAGYEEPRPVEPEDERARLMREYIAAAQQMSRIHARMERLAQAASAPAQLRPAA